MSLSSPLFLFLFLPACLAAFWLAGPRWRVGVLLAASAVFCVWNDGRLSVVLAASVVVNWALGRAIAPVRDARRGGWLTTAGVLANVGVLVAFKYADFLGGGVRWLLSLPAHVAVARPLPLGLSFFTFLGIAYLLDVRRGTIAAEQSLRRFALFTAFFPKLAAGPIVRYSDVAADLAAPGASVAALGSGARRFILGLGKKLLLADALARVADPIFAMNPADLSVGVAWLGLTAYTLQLYLDFDGYTDMAIGLGRMFGFTFRENFDHPYVSRSVTEFWRRWHISLSTWFRDYVYVPLSYALITEGVRRKIAAGRYRTNWRGAAAILVVFGLCGLWHGAGLNFLAWGLLHGAALAVESLGLSKRIRSWWRPLQHAYLLLVVMAGWVLFRIPSFREAIAYFRALVGAGGGDGLRYHVALFLNGESLGALAVGVAVAVAAPALAAAPALQARWRRFGGAVEGAWLTIVLALSLAALSTATFSPFIYQRF